MLSGWKLVGVCCWLADSQPRAARCFPRSLTVTDNLRILIVVRLDSRHIDTVATTKVHFSIFYDYNTIDLKCNYFCTEFSNALFTAVNRYSMAILIATCKYSLLAGQQCEGALASISGLYREKTGK